VLLFEVELLDDDEVDVVNGKKFKKEGRNKSV
jgi:hypothetical protein